MPRIRWTLVLIGAATFLAAHAIEVAADIGGNDPWFISTAPSALFTAAAMIAAGLLVGAWKGGTYPDAYVSAMALTAGAAVPLVVTLFSHPNGPGNLFPIALAIGVVLLAFASVAGVTIGWLLRRVAR